MPVSHHRPILQKVYINIATSVGAKQEMRFTKIQDESISFSDILDYFSPSQEYAENILFYKVTKRASQIKVSKKRPPQWRTASLFFHILFLHTIFHTIFSYDLFYTIFFTLFFTGFLSHNYFFTVTVTLTVLPFALTEMVAFPVFFPVITPLEFTVATFLLEEV